MDRRQIMAKRLVTELLETGKRQPMPTAYGGWLKKLNEHENPKTTPPAGVVEGKQAEAGAGQDTAAIGQAKSALSEALTSAAARIAAPKA